jgi:hypothetical protein
VLTSNINTHKHTFNPHAPVQYISGARGGTARSTWKSFFVWFSFDFPFLSSYFPSPSQGVLVYSIDVFLFFLHFSHKKSSIYPTGLLSPMTIAAIVFATLCAATACGLASPALAVATPSRWQQTYFAISNWVDPVVPSEAFEAAYQQMVDANFTLILGGFGAISSDAIDAQLKAAEKVGIRVAVAGAGGKNNVSWLPQS